AVPGRRLAALVADAAAAHLRLRPAPGRGPPPESRRHRQRPPGGPRPLRQGPQGPPGPPLPGAVGLAARLLETLSTARLAVPRPPPGQAAEQGQRPAAVPPAGAGLRYPQQGTHPPPPAHLPP